MPYFPCSGRKERSLDELLRTVFSAAQPAWEFLEETKGRTSCPVPQVSMPFKIRKMYNLASCCMCRSGRSGDFKPLVESSQTW